MNESAEQLDELDEEVRTWNVLADCIPNLEAPDWHQEPDDPGIEKWWAIYYLRRSQQKGGHTFCGSDEVYEMALNKSGGAWIPEKPGVYLFVALDMFLHFGDNQTIKVGESGNMLDRIVTNRNSHFICGSRCEPTNLKGYCDSYGLEWPDCIRDSKITLLLLPTKVKAEWDRTQLEAGLKALLNPLMK